MEDVLCEFNRLRNWQNHVPESLLVSEVDLMRKGQLMLPINPMEITHYNYISYKYFFDLYKSNMNFCSGARKIIQAAKRDYALLLEETVLYPRIYSDVPRTVTGFKAAKMSARIQGLWGDYGGIQAIDE